MSSICFGRSWPLTLVSPGSNFSEPFRFSIVLSASVDAMSGMTINLTDAEYWWDLAQNKRPTILGPQESLEWLWNFFIEKAPLAHATVMEATLENLAGLGLKMESGRVQYKEEFTYIENHQGQNFQRKAVAFSSNRFDKNQIEVLAKRLEATGLHKIADIPLGEFERIEIWDPYRQFPQFILTR